MCYNEPVNKKELRRLIDQGVMIMRMKKNYLIGAATLLVAFGLGGCTNSKSASAPTVNQPTSAKVTHHATKAHPDRSAAAVTAVTTTAPTKRAQARAIQAEQVPVTQTATSAKATSNASSAPTAQTASHPAPALAADPAVLQSFLAASGVKDQTGNAYALAKQSDGTYQVEVRHTGADQDPNVANLTGLYQYNPQTNQVETLDPVTGNFQPTK